MLIGEPGYFDAHEHSECYLVVKDTDSERNLSGWWNFIKDAELIIGTWTEDLDFHSEIKVLTGSNEKLNFVYACLHNDANLSPLVKQIFKQYYTHKKDIDFDALKISVNTVRRVNKNYICSWKQNFPNVSDEEFITDFILNDKYAVICDAHGDMLDKLRDLGLLSGNIKIY